MLDPSAARPSDSGAQIRFTLVVLFHDGFENPHFDLLLDLDSTGPVATWRSDQWPPVASSIITCAPVHRRLYLSYEGPISNGRGRVSQRFNNLVNVRHIGGCNLQVTSLDHAPICLHFNLPTRADGQNMSGGLDDV